MISPSTINCASGEWLEATHFDYLGVLMISIVLYGRNDNYGYNLHKRAALSLNCMAEVLTDPSDEILFVDYNTPDDFPTFPEAIQDTLTKRAREVLRILRVRPRIHERFKSKTHLLALEPIARNVAVRRSSPSNWWILSTNTDMIFVPQSGRSLSEIARRLTPGFYHAPRIEIPEALWESFDRHAPGRIIKTIREWGVALHLNEIVLGSKFIRYDGPGDFQLLLRSDLFDNHGFDEDMLLGWHVDLNIAARMLLKYEEVGDLGKHVYGYHCDHTRQVTPAHSHARVENDWKRFVTEVARADVPLQAASWGCADDVIEEVRLSADPARVYVQALRSVIGEPLVAPNIVKYTGETYNKVDYDPRHLLPFLVDMFVSLPRTSSLAWFGGREETRRSFADIWQRLGFTGKILLDEKLISQGHTTPAMHHVSTPELLAHADAFLFDFGGLPPSRSRSAAAYDLSSALVKSFHQVANQERCRLSEGATPRRIIALNAINNEYEGFVCGFVAAAATPFATHMRHGFVLPASTAWGNWLPLLSVGEAGVRVGDRIGNDPSKLGWVAYGPFKYLEAGRYLVSMEIELAANDADRPDDGPTILVEVAAGPQLLGAHLLRHRQLKMTEHEFTFVVPQDVAEGIAAVETRIGVLSRTGVVVRALTVEPVSASTDADEKKVAAGLTVSDLLRIDDWLPFLRVGPLGHADDSGVAVESGGSGFVIFGPYWSFPAGKYEMIAQIEPSREAPAPEHVIAADVTAGDRKVVAGSFHVAALRDGEKRAAAVLRFPFELRAQASELRQIETRIWSSGQGRFRIRSLAVKPLERREREDLYLGGEIQHIDKHVGFSTYSQAIDLEPGHYRLAFRASTQTDDATALRKGQLSFVAQVRRGADILALIGVTSSADPSGNHELVVEVPPDPAAPGIEFFMQVVTAAGITLRSLTVEPLGTAVQRSGPAVCKLDNWLPFLQTGSSAQADDDGVVVSQGPPEYVVYGPYWTLPAGRYEVIASVIPYSCNPEGKAVITVDVAADRGQRRFAARRWRLGQIQHADAHARTELRLPFTLAADLPAASRTIETRIFSPGDVSFRVCLLAVKIRSDGLKHDWLSYLTTRMPNILLHDLRDKAYEAAARVYRQLRRALEANKSAKGP